MSRCFKLAARLTEQVQGLGELPESLAMWLVDAALEVLDAPDPDRGAVGKRLLGQARGNSVLA